MSEGAFMTVTVADIDLLTLGALWFLDLRSGRRVGCTRVIPGGRLALPDRVGGGDVRFEHLGLAIGLREEAGGTRICAESRGLACDVTVPLPAGHETLNVVVSRDERRFLYSAKHAGRPARGEIRIGKRRLGVDGHGWLDFARGVWPYRSAWSWGSAAGESRGRRVALNLGATWTDGSTTENGLWVDGRLHKIDTDVVFSHDGSRWGAGRPFGVRGPRVDLQFTPLGARRIGGGLGRVRVALDLRIGRFDGSMRDDGGAAIAIDGLQGWAERFSASW